MREGERACLNDAGDGTEREGRRLMEKVDCTTEPLAL